MSALDGIRLQAEGLTDLCPEYLGQSIRHVQRNVDIDCNVHDNEKLSEYDCHQPGRHDGNRMARALADVPRLLGALDAILALHTEDEQGKCAECTVAPFSVHSVKWPCPTVAAVNDALEAVK